MATTLEELERRVAELETEVAALRGKPVPEKPARFGDNIPLIREARAQQAAISAAVAEAYAKMGITEVPVGPERLREMMLADGVDPNDNTGSREIIAMREE
ncbi:MAG TPA: hypothetical protein VFW33_10075 [Gemmataceae bacterium]|nr:hypothetical protein [Gemmataceae bacterium]